MAIDNFYVENGSKGKIEFHDRLENHDRRSRVAKTDGKSDSLDIFMIDVQLKKIRNTDDRDVVTTW